MSFGRLLRLGGVALLVGGLLNILLTGLILGVGGEIVSGFVLPWLATSAPKLAAEQGPPALIALFIITNLGGAVGAILLGLVTMRAGVLPRWAGVLLIIGGGVTVITAAPFPLAISTLLNNIATVIFFLGVVWIGYALWARKGEALQLTAASF